MTFDRKWDAVHRDRDWGQYPNENLVRWVGHTFGKVPDRRKINILDFGCGQGASTWFLAREGYSVTAVDGSEHALDKLTARLANEGIHGIPTECCDMEILPLTWHDKFDAVVDVVSICHNADPLMIYWEAARVLKPGGRLFSMAPRPTCWRVPFESYGAVSFLGIDSLRAAIGNSFDVKIGMADVLLPGSDPEETLRYWLVDGKKIG